jgi:hypothetical protein
MLLAIARKVPDQVMEFAELASPVRRQLIHDHRRADEGRSCLSNERPGGGRLASHLDPVVDQKNPVAAPECSRLKAQVMVLAPVVRRAGPLGQLGTR